MKQIKAILHWFAPRNGHTQEVLANLAPKKNSCIQIKVGS